MTRARDVSRLVNANQFTVDAANNRIGLGSETPDAKLDVAGIVSATAYYGDGSNLEGVASAGLGTAISDSGALSVIYYTDNTLTVGDDTTVDVPATSDSNVAYTQYAEIAVAADKDLIIADGDDFVPDILGITTDGPQGTLAGGGRLRVDNIASKSGSGSVYFNAGVHITGLTTFNGILTADNANVAGVVTATSFVGSGADLTDVISGIGITDSSVTSNLGTGLTAINFSGATVAFHEATGISTVTIAGWSQEDTWLFGS
jgi:hypothetical protein